LHQLVSDLLDFSSLQAGALPLRSETYSPRDVVESVVRALQPLALGKGLTLRCITAASTPDPCEGDPLRVSQVVSNLTGNAIKFTDVGSVTVTLEADDRVAGYRISVEDTGPGLPQDQRLFEPFHQGVRDAQGGAGGVGLGLAICRRLCERMGGALESERSAEGGARLCAVIPRRALGASGPHIEHFEPDLAASPLSPDFAARHPLAILVVDDTTSAREFVQAALRALGYEPDVAACAETAVELASATPYGLVLLDIQMPGADGWAAARRLRARLGTSAFLIALSANTLANDVTRLSDAGFDGFARKPLGMRELQALLRRAHQRSNGAASAGADVPTFDKERWRELRAIPTGASETAFDRMRRRVLDTLPQLLERTGQARAAGDRGEIARALHDLVGVFLLIGAAPAAALAKSLEARLSEGGPAEGMWQELEQWAARVRSELSALSDAR
jgi:DNA-binding response OmpR family regulator